RRPARARGDPGTQRDGSSVEARQEAGGWGPTDGHRGRLGAGRLPIHHRPESSRSAPTSRCPVGSLLVTLDREGDRCVAGRVFSRHDAPRLENKAKTATPLNKGMPTYDPIRGRLMKPR